MKDLDKTQVYSLDGITHNQAVELLEWLKVIDRDWDDVHLENIRKEHAIYHVGGDEWCCDYSKTYKTTTHISTLFPTKLEDLIKQRDELNKQIEEYGETLKIGDVCKFWNDGDGEFTISSLDSVDVSDYPYRDKYGTWHQYADILTQQEVFDFVNSPDFLMMKCMINHS